MGAITRIRQISPYFLAVIATLFIAFMVIQDSSCSNMRNSRGNGSSNAVAVVNGEEIATADFEARVKEAVDGQRRQNPDQEIDDEMLRDQVLDEMINEVLRRQEAEKMGLAVTQEQIYDFLVVNPPEQFQWGKDTAGRFDPVMQRNLVTNPDDPAISKLLERNGLTVEKWKGMVAQTENYLRGQMLQQAIASTVGTAVGTPSLAVCKRQFQQANSSADIEFIALPISSVRDEDVKAKVTADAVKKYYDENKQYYRQRPARVIEFIAIPQVASNKDTAIALEKSKALGVKLGSYATVEQRDSVFSDQMVSLRGSEVDYTSPTAIDPSVLTAIQSLAVREVFGPLNTAEGIAYYRLDDKREGVNPIARASHILIPFGVDKDSAKAEANTVLSKAKKGEDFAELARTYSKDPGSAQQGGDLNYFGKGRMVAEFDSAVFAAEAGSIVGPVETQFGYHIIKVTEKTSVEYKYSAITIKNGMSNLTKIKRAKAAEDIYQRISEGESMEAVAKSYQKEFYVQYQRTPAFTNETPIFDSRELTNWAFNNDVGAFTRKETKRFGMIIAQVSEIREEGIKPLEDVKEGIERILTDKAKLEKLRGVADRISATARSQGFAGAVALDTSLKLVTQIGVKANGMLTGFGPEYAATAAAYREPIGQISKAIPGESAWFVIKVTNRIMANDQDFKKNPSPVMQSLAQRAGNTAYSAWFQKVREKAEIKDNRFN